MRSVKLVVSIVLGVIAIGAAASPADASQEWFIEERPLAELGLSEETFEVTSKTSTVLSVPGFKLVLKCNTTKGSGKILAKAGAEVSLSLTGCEAVELPACTVKEPVTITAKSTLTPTSGAFHEKLEQPGEKTPMAKIKFGEKCSLPEEAELKGTLAGELPAEETVERVIKVSEAATKKVNEELKAGGASEYSLLYGTKSATLNGDFVLKLAGKTGTGKAWQPQPGAVLCKSPPTGARQECPAGESYPNNTVVKPETLEGQKVKWAFTLEGNNTVVTCEALRMEGLATSITVYVSMPISSVSFGAGCAGGCTVSAFELPWPSTLLYLATPHIFIHGPAFKFDCGTNKICKYKAQSLGTSPVKVGSPAKFELASLNLSRYSASETTCGANASMENESAGEPLRYKFWEPASLYLGFVP